MDGRDDGMGRLADQLRRFRAGPRHHGWINDAVCAHTPSDVFFAETTGPAAEYCGRCPIRLDCLDDLLRDEAAFGVGPGFRGGCTPVERTRLLATLSR